MNKNLLTLKCWENLWRTLIRVYVIKGSRRGSS